MGGGVVGGILGFFMLCALLYGYFQRKKRLARNREALLLSRADTENPAASEVVVVVVEEEEDPSMTPVASGVINSTRRSNIVPSFVSSPFLTWGYQIFPTIQKF